MTKEALKAHERLSIPPIARSQSQFSQGIKKKASLPSLSAGLGGSVEPWLKTQPPPLPLPPRIMDQEEKKRQEDLLKSLQSITLALQTIQDRLTLLEKHQSFSLFRTIWQLISWDKVRDWGFVLLFALMGFKLSGAKAWLGIWAALVRRRVENVAAVVA